MAAEGMNEFFFLAIPNVETIIPENRAMEVTLEAHPIRVTPLRTFAKLDDEHSLTTVGNRLALSILK